MSMKKKVKGRPPKAAGDARDNVLRIRLKPNERAIIDGTAKAKGLDSSAWARMVLLETARHEK
jgi:hypothetical protein